eukprot:m.24551 g.24551  ORF g.24551 m.24551 type:complete len:217 (+) comp28640_c0_seq1:163-813(+)
MPKKFKGGNPKAEAAKVRKEQQKVEKAEKVEREKEDAHWRQLEEEDKRHQKKTQRKTDREQKRQDVQERKLANASLLQEEESKLKGKERTEKVTRASIAKAQEEEETREAKARAKHQEEEIAAVEENPNRVLADFVAKEGIVEARSVEEAVATLSVRGGEGEVDLHPEKRMKGAFASFGEREMPRLKAENPTLRLSQLKQMLKKLWLKSPDNPFNA